MNISRYSLLIILALVVLQIRVHAQHQIGAHLSYKWVTGNDYELTLILYRDCAGIAAPDSVNVCIRSGSNGYSDSTKLPKIGTGFQLPPLSYLPSGTTSCNGGAYFGVERYTYTDTITIPIAASDVIVSYTAYFNSGGIITLPPPGPDAYGFYVSTRIDNINFPQNNSAQFTNDPLLVYCLNQPTWETYSAVDTDGDLLEYSIVPVLIDTFICPPNPFVSTIPNILNYYSPLNSTVPYYINTTDGWLYFHAWIIQVGFITIKVKEIRNGVPINETTFTHMQNSVNTCTLTGLPESENKTLSGHIFPSPVTDQLHVSFNNRVHNFEMNIFDITGKNVFNELKSDPLTESVADVSGLSPGVYTVVLSGNSTSGSSNIRKGYRNVSKFVKL